MENRRKPRVVDLFCGCGGLSEGFEQAGFEVCFLNDIDKSAFMTASKNHPNAKGFLGGIEFLSKEQIEGALGEENPKIEGIIGGPPCQGFSMANMQSRFIDNPRNSLFKHYVRLVHEIRPLFFVMENVEGLISMGNGKIVDAIIESFKDIGYKVDYWILVAADYGVPQIRKRVVFLGNRINRKNQYPVRKYYEPNGAFESAFSRFRTVGEAILDLPEIPSGSTKPQMNYDEPPNNEYQQMMREGSSSVFNHITTRHTKTVLERIKYIPQGGNWRSIPLKLMEDYTDITRTHSSVYKRLDENKPAITISNFRKSMILHPTQNRIISVREAARIQSFRDIYNFCGRINEQQQQVADAVPPLMSRAIAEELLNIL